ncbi:hypothetical protein PEX1_069120 [Penicillium expansum]|uniref:Uncharacterized protein n=1 Tax=Penicillium expansum TaxID=27334 RepID=A0A0A2JH82_PENEN|nr:hypothetical protein PEX2_026010 [Penicillium expansum]KGO38332.1 hypothetical protein PEXP_100700 [Penicillium expansum]KGO54063.1 hypothetical protein PEX2_026010 [Penicillium expansum]KGO63424.1 hypothetical protein PEX1_069120 [Penicillium expansum]
MYVSPFHTIIYTTLPFIVHPRLGDVCAPYWATGLDERGETIISEFRGTGFAGSAVRDGSCTRRGTVLSREWWFPLRKMEFSYLRGQGGREGKDNGDEKTKWKREHRRGCDVTFSLLTLYIKHPM